MDPATRTTLQTAQQALLHAHKALLEEERRRYEVVHGRVPSAMAFLQLLLNDPWFAWIRPMSGLAAQIDEALFAKAGENALPAGPLLEEARFLLTPKEDGDAFQVQYHRRIQESADVARAHGEAMRIWPATSGA